MHFISLSAKMLVKTDNIKKILLIFLVGLSAMQARAQSEENQEVVQFTGFVVASDGVTNVPGVHIYVPRTGRGTTSNIYGYFSMPAVVGDTVVLSAVGYIKQHFVMPRGHKGRVNTIFKMEDDTVFLQNVDVFPYLSEREFKKAILAMKTPDENKMLSERLDGAAMSVMLNSVPYDASMNARYYFDQQLYYMQDSYGPRSNPFLNPFNWAKFIKSIKKKKK